MNGIVIKNVGFAYTDVPILSDVSFSVAPGELVCLVGPSGCGKSSLLRLVAGLEEMQGGEVFLDGALLNVLSPQQRRIGMVFQQPSLFPHLTVSENIGFGLPHKNKAEREATIKRYVHMIGMEAHAEAYPHMLSGGQQQRVALARSLAPEPRAMLLDEPFANLDHQLRREIREDVLDILTQANIPIVMVTHDPEEALMIADRMVLLTERGRVRQIGTPDAVHNHPVDRKAAAFFGVVNEIRGEVKGKDIVSPIGVLPKKEFAPHTKHGQKVTIVTRPEGLRINKEGNVCVNATVTKTRHTGAGWLITAILGSGERIRFHHIYGECPMVDQKVCIAYELPHIFVF